MPELPEVETIRRTLEPDLASRRIAEVGISGRHVTGPTPPAAFAAALRGRVIERLWRRGKYLVFDLGPGPKGPAAGRLAVVGHLRMTGRLCYLAPRAHWTEAAAHTHAQIRLDGGGRLVFHDVRKFGRLLLLAPEAVAAALPKGRDPLHDGVDGPALQALFGQRASPLKALLLRQDLLCGLGNIYADEALFRAGLNPARPGRGVPAMGWAVLASGISGVLDEALSLRGTTLFDYRTGKGERGAFAAHLNVYGRSGRPCRRCGTEIVSCRLAGRTTCWCPVCQAPP